MKRLIWILISILMLISTFGYTQQVIYVTGSKTVYWNAVIMTGDISYEIYAKKSGIETLLGSTTLTTYDVNVTFLGEGTYTIGVRTVRIIDEQTFYSDINWSNVNGAWTPSPFVFVYYLLVPAPENLRIEE